MSTKNVLFFINTSLPITVRGRSIYNYKSEFYGITLGQQRSNNYHSTIVTSTFWRVLFRKKNPEKMWPDLGIPHERLGRIGVSRVN